MEFILLYFTKILFLLFAHVRYSGEARRAGHRAWRHNDMLCGNKNWS